MLHTGSMNRHRRVTWIPDDCRIRLKSQVLDDDAGWVEGYSVAFNVRDADGDIVLKGAFKKSIQEQIVAKGGCPFMVKHWVNGGDVLETMGTTTQAREDDYGLWTHNDLSADQDAQTIRAKINGKHIKHLSASFDVLQGYAGVDDHGQPCYYITEARIIENTATAFPKNQAAIITRSKDQADEIIRHLQQQVKTLEERLTAIVAGPTPNAEHTAKSAAVSTSGAAITEIDMAIARNREFLARYRHGQNQGAASPT